MDTLFSTPVYGGGNFSDPKNWLFAAATVLVMALAVSILMNVYVVYYRRDKFSGKDGFYQGAAFTVRTDNSRDGEDDDLASKWRAQSEMVTNMANKPSAPAVVAAAEAAKAGFRSGRYEHMGGKYEKELLKQITSQ